MPLPQPPQLRLQSLINPKCGLEVVLGMNLSVSGRYPVQIAGSFDCMHLAPRFYRQLITNHLLMASISVKAAADMVLRMTVEGDFNINGEAVIQSSELDWSNCNGLDS